MSIVDVAYVSHLERPDCRSVRFGSDRSPRLAHAPAYLRPPPIWPSICRWNVQENMSIPADVGSVKYCLPEPFEEAVETVCRSLSHRGLRIAGHLDVSARVQRALRIVLPPCRIVFVLPSRCLFNAGRIHPCVAALLPLHVVIAGGRGETEVQIQNRVQARVHTEMGGVFAPVIEAQIQLSAALDAVAIRPCLIA